MTTDNTNDATIADLRTGIATRTKARKARTRKAPSKPAGVNAEAGELLARWLRADAATREAFQHTADIWAREGNTDAYRVAQQIASDIHVRQFQVERELANLALTTLRLPVPTDDEFAVALTIRGYVFVITGGIEQDTPYCLAVIPPNRVLVAE